MIMICDICDGLYPVSKHNFDECYSLDFVWDLKQMAVIYSVGSMTAKNGYKEEEFVATYINENEPNFMDIFGCTSKNAYTLTGNTKTDIIWSYNIQHKKTKEGQFGQVCRYWLDYMHIKVPMCQNVFKFMKDMCELPLDKNNTKMCDKSSHIVKLTSDNYTVRQLNSIIEYFEKNKQRLIEMVLLGYDEKNIPDIFSCTVFKKNKRQKLMMWKMDTLIQYFSTQICKIRKSGTVIEIGLCLTFQRKGGDNGKKQANQFQFKMIPTRIPLQPLFVKTFDN
jgi:hypothetical protein